jgi:hypothetical protein
MFELWTTWIGWMFNWMFQEGGRIHFPVQQKTLWYFYCHWLCAHNSSVIMSNCFKVQVYDLTLPQEHNLFRSMYDCCYDNVQFNYTWTEMLLLNSILSSNFTRIIHVSFLQSPLRSHNINLLHMIFRRNRWTNIISTVVLGAMVCAYH